MQDDCGVEPEVAATSAQQTNENMTARSNRAVSEMAAKWHERGGNIKKTRERHRKRRRRFLHNGKLARESSVTSVYCTASLPCRRFLVSVLTTVQEYRYILSVCIIAYKQPPPSLHT